MSTPADLKKKFRKKCAKTDDMIGRVFSMKSRAHVTGSMHQQ
jgi:hypothetical protein